MKSESFLAHSLRGELLKCGYKGRKKLDQVFTSGSGAEIRAHNLLDKEISRLLRAQSVSNLLYNLLQSAFIEFFNSAF